VKYCRRCQQWKRPKDFPVDRSRRDGRWHTCSACNKQRCRLLRKAARERKKRALTASPPPDPAPRWRLYGLESYRNRSDEPFSRLSPVEKFIAWQLFGKYLHRHRGPRLSQPKCALLMACAASNARRVGDRSWSRRMKRLKGWHRQRRKEFEQLVSLAAIRARNAARQRGSDTGIRWTPESRLWGV